MNYESEIAKIEGIVAEKKNFLKLKQVSLRELKEELIVNQKASDIVNAVSSIAQQSTKAFIEEVVSLAISTVYNDEYRFELVIDTNRGQTTIKPTYIDKDGNQYEDLKNDAGGGLADVISFGMRIALWAIKSPRSDSVFILDEPGKALGELLPKFAEVLNELSRKLGIQFIIITHDKALADLADKSYRVTKEKRISKVMEI